MPDISNLEIDEDKLVDAFFEKIEGDYEGQNKFLGIRWKIGPKMSCIMCENRIVSPFTSLILVFLRLIYILKQRSNQ